jgi:hypothetical protein
MIGVAAYHVSVCVVFNAGRYVGLHCSSMEFFAQDKWNSAVNTYSNMLSKHFS